MPRYAILEHDYPARHWDLFLEAGSVVRGWRLLAEPNSSTAILAEPSADHRLLYLDYEGPVSGNRGRVVRWDAGTFEWIADEPDRLVLELRGSKLCGRYRIENDHFGPG